MPTYTHGTVTPAGRVWVWLWCNIGHGPCARERQAHEHSWAPPRLLLQCQAFGKRLCGKRKAQKPRCTANSAAQRRRSRRPPAMLPSSTRSRLE